jgi:hypothetical protein
MTTQEQRQWVAMHHEGGHAVACTRLGVDVFEVTANDGDGHVTFEPLTESRGDLERLVLIALAGEQAVELFGFSDELGTRRDLAIAREALTLLYGAEDVEMPLAGVIDRRLEQYRRLTRELLLGHDNGIQLGVLARSVPTWGTLGGEAWEDLYDRTTSPRMLQECSA